jgi:hypothetical protein
MKPGVMGVLLRSIGSLLSQSVTRRQHRTHAQFAHDSD